MIANNYVRGICNQVVQVDDLCVLQFSHKVVEVLLFARTCMFTLLSSLPKKRLLGTIISNRVPCLNRI